MTASQLTLTNLLANPFGWGQGWSPDWLPVYHQVQSKASAVAFTPTDSLAYRFSPVCFYCRRNMEWLQRTQAVMGEKMQTLLRKAWGSNPQPSCSEAWPLLHCVVRHLQQRCKLEPQHERKSISSHRSAAHSKDWPLKKFKERRIQIESHKNSQVMKFSCMKSFNFSNWTAPSEGPFPLNIPADSR